MNQTKYTWISINTGRNCENGFKREPMPKGPYIIREQFSDFKEGTTWQEALLIAQPNEFIFKIPDSFFTYSIYANIDGMAVCVAWHMDTSD